VFRLNTFASGTIKDLASNRYAGTTSYDLTPQANTLAGTAAINVIKGLGALHFSRLVKIFQE
jgi:hypothetical protein